jgi:hypothetical protein
MALALAHRPALDPLTLPELGQGASIRRDWAGVDPILNHASLRTVAISSGKHGQGGRWRRDGGYGWTGGS